MRLHSPTFGEQAKLQIVTETNLSIEWNTIIKEMRGIDKKFSPYLHSLLIGLSRCRAIMKEEWECGLPLGCHLARAI